MKVQRQHYSIISDLLTEKLFCIPRYKVKTGCIHTQFKLEIIKCIEYLELDGSSEMMHFNSNMLTWKLRPHEGKWPPLSSCSSLGKNQANFHYAVVKQDKKYTTSMFFGYNYHNSKLPSGSHLTLVQSFRKLFCQESRDFMIQWLEFCIVTAKRHGFDPTGQGTKVPQAARWDQIFGQKLEKCWREKEPWHPILSWLSRHLNKTKILLINFRIQDIMVIIFSSII